MKLLKINILLFNLLLISGLQAQTELQVVTRSIEKSWVYEDGIELNIEGEKAEIIVETWAKNEVSIQLKLISKHPDKKTAVMDLQKLKYAAEQHGNNIYFRNYVSVGENEPKPESDLEAVYTVTLPEECPVYLKNNFGNATVSNLTNSLKLNTTFTNVGLNNLSGEMDFRTRFGDLNADGLDGNVFIQSRRTDITLADITGDFDIRAVYGVLKLFTDQRALNLNIDAEKADVYFFDPAPTDRGYLLTAHYGNITAPSNLKFNYLENSKTLKRAVFKSPKDLATISVKITFGDIIIRNP